MRLLTFAFIATLALAGAARGQETTAHDHEHGQPAAAGAQSAGAEHEEMCACCRKEGGMDMTAMRAKMADKMKEMKTEATRETSKETAK